jgi:AcrR family transcriptional regulator
MQRSDSKTPRTNRERTEATSKALLDAARALFVERGYGETSTPDISTAAGTTRGALYHHFVDKRDVFRHVLAREAQAVRDDIEAASRADLSPADALIAGSHAYLDAMTVPGRTRLLLIEGPAVLGAAQMTALDDANAAATLRAGLAAANAGADGVALDALAQLVSAAFDRAALAIDAGGDAPALREAMVWLLRRVLPAEPPARKSRR